MALDKKELGKVVDFVKKVKELPGNEEFITALRMVLRENTATIDSTLVVGPQKVVVPEGETNAKIDAIEKYLGLDYQLDNIPVPIDYSFVKDTDIRNQLESDYREMLRYRHGTRGHKVDFFEFCRYVQLQTELLLNYYDVKFCGDEEMYDAILNSKTPREAKKYSTLLYDFNKQYKLKNYDILNNGVRAVRNIQSHRTSTDLSSVNFDIISRAEKFADANKIWFNKDWYYLKYKVFENNDALCAKFNKEVGVNIEEYKEIAKKANLANFIHTTPYPEIFMSLNELATKISQNLAKLGVTNSQNNEQE